ncbi:gp436 family protein [Tropicibacter sp. S64]|uniref:gp436 family protein n=1 Tax=Tropicibacter sp. S64 TaxID=3415122 RepID=UPI003C79FA78
MAYSTQADLEKHYGTALLVNLTDRGELASGVIDADVVTQAIADADAMIDGYIKTRYTLPLDGVPDPIGVLSRRIAIYNLHVFEPSSKIVRDYEGAIATLKDIGKGIVQLDADGVTPETSGGGGAQLAEGIVAGIKSDMGGFV